MPGCGGGTIVCAPGMSQTHRLLATNVAVVALRGGMAIERDVGKAAGGDGAAVRSAMGLGTVLTTTGSLVALLVSGASLWETALKRSDLRVFVPPVIQYSSPYNNSNFEMIGIPVTLTNEGARSGVVLSMELAVTDPKTKQTKRFFAAEFGRWSMERTRALAYQAFSPISLAGRSSRTESVLFYTRGDDEKPPQLIREPGMYEFKLTLEEAQADDIGFLDRLWRRPAGSLVFERELKFYDARAFTNGTIPMYAKDWRSRTSGAAPAK